MKEFFGKLKLFILSKHFLKQLGLVVVAYLVIITITVFYLDTYTHHGEQIAVPDFKDKNVNSVATQIEELGLQYEVLDSVYKPELPSGTIISQNPKPTAKSLLFVKEGRIIRFRVSKKTDNCTMPKLVDLQEDFAKQCLKNRGLKYIVVYKSNAEADGAVLDQLFKGRHIKEDTRIRKGSIITIVVGKMLMGEPVQIPDVYGLTIFEAKERLAELGSFVFNVQCPECLTYEDSTAARVTSQSPEYLEGATIQTGSTFTINASKNFSGDGQNP
jgi:beta-lactam-binding protein with PASTA domain